MSLYRVATEPETLAVKNVVDQSFDFIANDTMYGDEVLGSGTMNFPQQQSGKEVLHAPLPTVGDDGDVYGNYSHVPTSTMEKLQQNTRINNYRQCDKKSSLNQSRDFYLNLHNRNLSKRSCREWA